MLWKDWLRLLSTIEQVKSSVNPRLNIEGVLRTMYDARNRLCSEVSKQLLEHFLQSLSNCNTT